MKLTIVAPLAINEQHARDEQDTQLLSDIHALLHGVTVDISGVALTANWSLLSDPDDFPGLSEILNSGSGSAQDRILYRFDLDLTALSDRTITMFGHDFGASDFPHIAYEFASNTLYSILATVFISSQIAAPGAIDLRGPLEFHDGRYAGALKPVSWLLSEALNFAEHLRWPVIRHLDLKSCYDWLTAIPSFPSGMGRGRVGRAVAALTQIICKPASMHTAVDISWAVLGLEALYAEGNQGLAQQILKKSEVLLGERTENKKQFTRMYDYRSRFLHGDLDIPLAFREAQHDDVEMEFGLEAYECWGIACSILVASLQELVIRNTHEPKFTWKFTPS